MQLPVKMTLIHALTLVPVHPHTAPSQMVDNKGANGVLGCVLNKQHRLYCSRNRITGFGDTGQVS